MSKADGRMDPALSRRAGKLLSVAGAVGARDSGEWDGLVKEIETGATFAELSDSARALVRRLEASAAPAGPR